MNFDYTDDQKALKDEARRFLSARSPVSVARGVLDAADRSYDEALWKAVAEQGWCGAAIPEAYGGLGIGHIELCALAEELGRSLAPIPFASSVYAFAEALMLAGSEDQKQARLPAVAAGSLIGALGVSEGPGRVAPGRLKTTVSDGRLTGEKLPVTDGDVADMCLVLAAENGAPGLYLVDLKSAGVSRHSISTLDPTRSAARIVFAGAACERLGDAGQGFHLLERIQDRAAVLLAFEQLGGADRCLEMARDYALQRYAFGRPIGSYQAIKHKLADVFVKNEAARANAYYAAWALAADAPELPIAAAAARIGASDAYWLAAKENIQTHGGIGFTWEADCHLFYRRSRHLAVAAGAPRVWKARLVERLQRRDAA